MKTWKIKRLHVEYLRIEDVLPVVNATLKYPENVIQFIQTPSGFWDVVYKSNEA